LGNKLIGMRKTNFQRLDNTRLSKLDLNYLHYLSLHKDVKEAIHKYANGKVLDIGCGNKPYKKEFEERVSQYIGCDIEQSSLEQVDIICDAMDIPLPSDEFDTIFSTQVLEHVAEHQLVLNEAYRLLKAGGKIIISVPFYWPPHEEPYDYFRFTKYGLQHILEKAGFIIVEVKENGGSWATTGQSIIHSTMNSTSKNFLLRVWRLFFFRLKLYRLHNSFFAWLDRVDFNAGMTMNYVVIAKK